MMADATIEVPTSSSLFPPNKPRLSKPKLLAAAVSAVVLLGTGVVAIGYWMASGKPLAKVSPLEVSNSAPIASVVLPPEADTSVPLATAGIAPAASEPSMSVSVLSPVETPSSAPAQPSQTQPSGPQSAPAAPVTAAAQPIATDIATLEARIAVLEKQLATVQALLNQRSPAVAEPNLKQRVAVRFVSKPVAVPKHRQAPAETPKPVVSTSTETTAPAPADKPEQLVAIDYWGGKPSIVIKGRDGKVRFASEGDSINAGRIVGVHSANGSISVLRPDGSRETLQIREAR